MRVCDRCMKKLNGNGSAIIEVNLFGTSGACIKRHNTELCYTCYQKIEDYIKIKKEEVIR